MIKCDFCNREIPIKSVIAVKWFGGVGNSGELHFHKNCMCQVLRQIKSTLINKSKLDIDINSVSHDMDDYGTIQLHEVSTY